MDHKKNKSMVYIIGRLHVLCEIRYSINFPLLDSVNFFRKEILPMTLTIP